MATKARPLTALASVAVVAAIAGCGTAVATGSPPPRSQPVIPGTLCAAASYVDSLTISRTDAFPSNHVRFTFPPTVTTSAQQARTVARAVCGLPRFPGGMMSCPMDSGISYRLDFGASIEPGSRERHFPPVTVDATGCQQVTGAGSPRWLAVTPRFWTVLGTAAGIADPGAAFRGCASQLGTTCPKNATYTA